MSTGEWDWLIALILQPIQTTILSQVTQQLSGLIGPLLQPLRALSDRLREIRQGFLQMVGQLLSGLVSPMATIAHRIASSPHQLLAGLVSPMVTIAHRIASSPHQLLAGLVSPMVTIAHRIASSPNQLLAGLVSPMVTIGARIASSPNQLLAGLMSPLVTIGVRLGISNQAQQALPAALGSVGLSWLTADQEGKQRLQDRAWQNVVALGGQLQAGIQSAGNGAVPAFLEGLKDFTVNTLRQGYDGLLAFILENDEITPELAPTVGVRAFLAASGLGAAAHLVSTAVELVHPLKAMGVHYLSGFLADMGSFSSISNALMGTMAQVAIANPMRYYLNNMTRATIPTPGDLQAMHRKHTLSQSDFARYMNYWGYNEAWVENYIEYLPADPRLFDILRMAEAGIPETSPPADALPTLRKMGIRAAGNPDWWLEMKFALAGYNWIDIPMLVDTVHRRLTATERNRLVTTASVNFRDGYMTEADYRLELAAAGKTQDQVDWRVRAERLAALNDDIDDLVKLYVDKFLKDQLTYDELVIAMVNVGVTPTKSGILARRAAIRKLPKPVDDTDKRQEKAVREMQAVWSRMYKEQYRADMITADGYYSSLRSIGIREDVAWATVELEIARRIGKAKKVETRAAARALTRVQTAQQRLYRDQFRAGQVDQGTYYNLLVQAGMLPAEADPVVTSEVIRQQASQAEAAASLARAEQTRTVAAYQRLYRDQFRAYMIDAGQYLANLGLLGISEDRARAIVAAEVTNREADLVRLEAREAEQTQRAAQRAQQRLLQGQYDAGLIDADQYLAGLLQIGTDPELAWATVELAEVNRFDLLHRAALKDAERAELAVQKAQAQLYTRRYRAGELTPGQLYRNLVDIGIPELLAATTVDLEMDQRQAEADQVRESLVIPAIKRAWTLFVKDAERRYKAGELVLDQYIAELVFSGVADDIARIIALAEQRIRET